MGWRWHLREYRTLLLIFAVGALTGFLAWLAIQPSPSAPPCGQGPAARSCAFRGMP